MGYDVHITRRENWFDREGPAISLGEWTSVVRNDPEMRLDSYAEARVGEGRILRVNSEGLSVWTAYSGHEKDGNVAWFDLSHGNIVVKNPDPEILRKMYAIAHQLSAKVQGDDGELYHSQGNVSPAATHGPRSPAKKRWWNLW
jgi:hypothetical protein